MPLRLPSSTTAMFRASRAAPTYTRTFMSSRRMAIKEDADRSPEQIEKKKQESLEKQKRGEGHWHEELGSASESNVAADREEVQDHDSHISKLQQETKTKGEKGHLD